MTTRGTTHPNVSGHLQRYHTFAYAAAGWAFGFAAVNFYWGMGGTIGLDTLGEGMAAQARAGDSLLLTLNWISVAGKVVIGLMALALVRWRERPRIQRLLHLAIWGAGLLITLYGIGNFIQHLLMLAGTLPIASLLGSSAAVRLHLLIWDPVWILGGVLFIVLAWQHGVMRRGERA
jgi:hypothetical protein